MWLRGARVLLAVFAVVFAVFVARAFKRQPAAPAPAVANRVDPTAVVESEGGTVRRLTGSREDGSTAYEHLLTYADGSSRMTGVTITIPDRGGRGYTITAEEAKVGKDEAGMTLTGGVHVLSTDGLSMTADQATYTDASGVVQSQGPVAFSRGRLSGSGHGMTYNAHTDVLIILADADIHVKPDDQGQGRADLAARTATFPRRDHLVRLDGDVVVHRDDRLIVADSAVAYLAEDEQRVTLLALHDRASVSTPGVQPGGLQALSADAIDLQYRDDGTSLEAARLNGHAEVQFAAARGGVGRRIAANTLQIALAADGVTATGLNAQTAVALTLPAEAGSPARRIRSDALTAEGQAGAGLTSAHLTGHVDFREQGASAERVVTSGVLDVTLTPGEGALEDARFGQAVRLTEGDLRAQAAAARYDVAKGTIALSGVEPPPGPAAPRVVNDQIDVQATRVDLTLQGPDLHAQGSVKSILKPASSHPAPGEHPARMPALLKKDQPVNVTSDDLVYDGSASKGVYTGSAWLWQGDTSIKGDSLTLNGATGDLAASGRVTTTTILTESNADGTTERVASVATSQDFLYEDGPRRATYTGDAHLSGSERDMTATKIELYLSEGGDELDRAEAYEHVSLHEEQRKTTGSRLTYTAADEKYVVTGTPADILDECGRDTKGQRILVPQGQRRHHRRRRDRPRRDARRNVPGVVDTAWRRCVPRT